MGFGQPKSLTQCRRFFVEARTPKQRAYEALRAYFVEARPSHEVARAFGYSPGAFRVMCHQFRRERAPVFFVTPRRGPRTQPKKSAARDTIIALRKRNYSVYEIIDHLLNNAYNCPVPHYRSCHETIWFGQAVGEATTAGHCPVANGHIISRRCPGGGGSVEFGGALEASLSAQRPHGVTQSADSRASASLDEGPAGAPPLAAPAWSARRRAHDGVVDPPAHCHADRGRVRCSLQCRRRMEAVAARPRVELAETRTPRSSTE